MDDETLFYDIDASKEETFVVASECAENDPSIGKTSESKTNPVGFSTPPSHKISTEGVKRLNTLESMYATLKDDVLEDFTEGEVIHRNASMSAEIAAIDVNALVAKVWVVRYVDFTSKYGLGFLFNTGCAGVYFNDSTKIVLSADGSVFQYTDRRRNDTASGEHISQKHLISAYPIELQKKVILLSHFRNYLLEQQLQNESANALQSDAHALMQKDIKNHAAQGACASVQFGQSSTSSNTDTQSSKEQELPFLKKWVRTKHAVVFRMSNRSVQVVFFDRSEVLVFAKARVITYVSKLGQRSDHMLDDVLPSGTVLNTCRYYVHQLFRHNSQVVLHCIHTPFVLKLQYGFFVAGRTDIAKRLKYTKDVITRLINTEKEK